MDLDIVDTSLRVRNRRKKWVIWLALAGLSGYGAYRVYNFPGVCRKRKKLMRLISALVSMAEAVSDSAKAFGAVSRDIKEFLRSDGNEIPNSLRQVSKIAKSDEFSVASSRVTEAFTIGILRGYKVEQVGSTGAEGVDFSFTERVADKLFTSSGTGFMSTVVGCFSRNLVLGFYGGCPAASGGSGNNTTSSLRDGFDSSNGRWMSLVCSDKSRELIAECIQKFVSTAVAVYLDKTMNTNIYDELFAGLTNLNHEAKIRDTLTLLCNDAVEALLRTSHQVLTSPGSSSEPVCSNGHQQEASLVPLSEFLERKFTPKQHEERVPSSKATSTLPAPSNRKPTLEMMRSFMAFMSRKISESMKKGTNVVQEDVLSQGRQMVGFVGGKSGAILAICIAAYLVFVWIRRGSLAVLK
ncbi:hypothetical protein MLD38_034853 [Melastoma candidum]|uniref:Uncharacterized protein n=1 Tax=Melastoma candidum TaxID=119954 RepID=A0ACB9MCP1_9MYRT|nr:hypothetical protein MLD38_034853 [Melastoma candidum]